MYKVVDLDGLYNKVDEYNKHGADIVLVSIWKDIRILVRNEWKCRYSTFKNNDVENILASVTSRIIERLIKRRAKGDPYNKKCWKSVVYWEMKYQVYRKEQQQKDKEISINEKI